MQEISRRRFFGLLGGVVATAVAPPIFVLPPVGGWRQGTEGLFTPETAGEPLLFHGLQYDVVADTTGSYAGIQMAPLTDAQRAMLAPMLGVIHENIELARDLDERLNRDFYSGSGGGGKT